VAATGEYADLDDKPTLGTASALNTPIPMSSISQPVKSTIDAINALGDSAAYHNASEFKRYTAALISSLTVSNTEKSLVSLALPANSLKAGSFFRFRGHGVFSMALVQVSLSTCRVRIGPLSLVGSIAASVTVNNGRVRVSAPFMVEGEITVRSIGALGSIGGWLAMWGAADAPFTDDITGNSVFVPFNSTVPNVLEITYATTNAAAMSVFDVALIDGG
jgi:hypothetical protein